MEYCEGRLLEVREEMWEQVVMEVVRGLRCLKEKGIVHRDLKPDNVMIKNRTPKIIDFGFARRGEEWMREYLGTPLYMAPQVLEGGGYSSKCDIWSLGILIYEMVFKRTPWY